MSGAQSAYVMLTSSPEAISLIATTRAVGADAPLAPRSGKTTTALGSHEWLKSATKGETTTPMGVRSGAESVIAFVENCMYVLTLV
jgi:hypothetical protein